MKQWLQYDSKRLGDEFINIQSYKRGFKTRCAQCKAPYATIHSLSFGADFCRPGCYIKFNRDYIRHMYKELMKVD
jgi:hypothetical protein